MIVNRLELNDAVAEGIVSRDQAVRLHELSVRSSGGDDSLIDLSHDTRDEPFRLLRGFRDVFIAIGVGIFVVGLSAMVLPITGKFWSDLNVLSVGESVFSIFIPLGLCIFGLVQAEIITRIYRLPLSSLVAVLAFAVWSANLFGLIASLSIASFSQFSGQIFHPAESIVIWAAAAGAMSGTAVFYWRYRLPFALFLLAGSLVGLSLLIIRGVMGAQWFEDYARILIGLWGSIVFLAAMWFDTRDRLRVTRFSECAFWLHLFAAPMLVHAFLFGDPLGAAVPAAEQGEAKLVAVVGRRRGNEFAAALFEVASQRRVLRRFQQLRVDAPDLAHHRSALVGGKLLEPSLEVHGEQPVEIVPLEPPGDLVRAGGGGQPKSCRQEQ